MVSYENFYSHRLDCKWYVLRQSLTYPSPTKEKETLAKYVLNSLRKGPLERP